MYRLLLSLILLCTLGRVYGQSDSVVSTPNAFLSVSPFHFVFRDGLKLELGKKISPKNYLFVSPEFYRGKLELSDSGRFWGAGLQLGGKHIIGTSARSDGLRMTYAALSVQYNYFHLTGNGFRWIERVENGLTYYDYALGPVYRKINRLSFDFNLGIMHKTETRFYWEVAAGAALRFSDFQSTPGYSVPNHRNKAPWDLGYTGLTPLLHLRIGMILD